MQGSGLPFCGQRVLRPAQGGQRMRQVAQRFGQVGVELAGPDGGQLPV